ncbi:MAG: DNA methyltransferase, partial [Gemmatimonadota bacterium]
MAGSNGGWANRIVAHGSKPASQFQAHPDNFRLHPQAQRDAVAASLRELGWVNVVLENVRTGHLIDGHERIFQALQNDDAEVPYIQVDLSEQEEALALSILDPITSMATVDAAKLDELLRDVSTGEEALQALLATLAEDAGLYQAEPAPDPGAQVDRAAELQEQWQTARGQVWEIPGQAGTHRLMCGDSTSEEDVQRLMAGKEPETVFFDPPYDADGDVLSVRWSCRDVLVFTDHRHLLDCVEGWPEFRSVFVWDGVTSWFTPGWPLARGKFCLWFGESDYDPNGAHYGEPDAARTVRNTRGEYHYKPDPRGKHLSTVYQFQNTRVEGEHAHAKPLEWVRMLIANCTNGVVFDPFCGSGTTIVACEQLKRLSRGMESAAENVAVTLERVAQMGLVPELVAT